MQPQQERYKDYVINVWGLARGGVAWVAFGSRYTIYPTKDTDPDCPTPESAFKQAKQFIDTHELIQGYNRNLKRYASKPKETE